MPTIPNQGKVCTRCYKWKYYDEFHSNKNRKDGKRGECKECVSKIFKAWYQAHRGECIYQKSKYQRGPGRKKKASTSLWHRVFNREKIREFDREYYRANREKRLAQFKAYRERKKAQEVTPDGKTNSRGTYKGSRAS